MMSAFAFQKCFYMLAIGFLLLYNFSFTIYMVKSSQNICLKVFLYVFLTLVKINVYPLSKLPDGKTLFINSLKLGKTADGHSSTCSCNKFQPTRSSYFLF